MRKAGRSKRGTLPRGIRPSGFQASELTRPISFARRSAGNTATKSGSGTRPSISFQRAANHRILPMVFDLERHRELAALASSTVTGHFKSSGLRAVQGPFRFSHTPPFETGSEVGSLKGYAWASQRRDQNNKIGNRTNDQNDERNFARSRKAGAKRLPLLSNEPKSNGAK